jgi:hypothetical protein
LLLFLFLFLYVLYIYLFFLLYTYYLQSIYIYAWETQREGGETGRSTSERGDAKQEPQLGEAKATHQEAHNGNTQRETKKTVLRISSWGAQQEQGETHREDHNEKRRNGV